MADSAASIEHGQIGSMSPKDSPTEAVAVTDRANTSSLLPGHPCVLASVALASLARHRDVCLSATIGLVLFLALAPVLAVGRQAAVLLMAGLVGSATHLVESQVLPLLPIDPVYGGAGLRVLGGIEPRGLAVAGPVGALLHWLLPASFASPELAVPGTAVSALVGPGVTVLARLAAALLATAVLLTLVVGLTGWMSRLSWQVAGRLAQVWLLLDLARETDLGVRDLEATGLPFALAAFAPVDAHGQRVLLTTHLDSLPDGVIGCLSAALAVTGCMLGVALVRGAARVMMALLAHRPGGRRVPTLTVPSIRGELRLAAAHGPRLFPLVAIAVMVSLSPLATLAEGETAVLLPETLAADATESTVLSTDVGGPESVASAAGEIVATAEATPAPVLATTADPAPVPAGSVVTLEGGRYQYTMRVNGRPTVVRGMGYNPWYASLPTDERQQRYRRDFSTMREIGVNTLEGWFQNQFDEVTLDEADRNGLKVIMPFELNQDYDYSDPAVKAMFRQQVTEWVLRYREHPAVLMWGPGNEVMHRLIFPTAVQGQRDPAREHRADDFAAFYVELIDMIRTLDPDHPVVYRDAEDLYFTRLRSALLKDGSRRPWFIYGTNVYTQKIADVIGRWPSQGLDAPLLVSEFSPGGSGAAERPGMLGWYWSTIRAHPERVLGGVVYTWTTQGPEDLDRVFGLTDPSGAPVDGSVAALQQIFRDDLVSRRAP